MLLMPGDCLCITYDCAKVFSFGSAYCLKFFQTRNDDLSFHLSLALVFSFNFYDKFWITYILIKLA